MPLQPEHDTQVGKTYRAADVSDFQRKVNSAAAMGGPLKLVQSGIQELVNDGSLASEEGKQYSAFYELVSTGKRNAYEGQGIIARSVGLECVLSVPETSPEALETASKSRLREIASGARVTFVEEPSGSVSINPVPLMSLQEFSQAYLTKDGPFAYQWRAFTPPIPNFRIPEMTGISRKQVSAYLDANEYDESREIPWSVIVGKLRFTSGGVITRNQVLLNIAEYIGVPISDRTQYNNGLRQVTFKELAERAENESFDPFQARMVSRGYLTDREITGQFPRHSTGRSCEPLLTMFDLREMIFRKQFGGACLEKLVEQGRAGKEVSGQERNTIEKMQKIRRELYDGFCRELEYQCTDMPSELPVASVEAYKKKRLSRAYSHGVVNAPAREETQSEMVERMKQKSRGPAPVPMQAPVRSRTARDKNAKFLGKGLFG